MADATLKDMNYGHPGTATYDLETKEWLFAREYTKKSLKEVQIRGGVKQSSSLPCITSVRFASPRIDTHTTSIQKHAKHLAHDFPQLAPGFELLPELALLSTAIHNTTSKYDPLVGDLMSFGSVTHEDRYDNPRRIAAVPVGEVGNILKLSFVNRERLTWGFDKSIHVEGPSLRDAECAYWNEAAAPIQQICFAQSEDRSSLLAVRLPCKTVFFRPLYHRNPRAAQHSQFYDLPPSTIDPCPIFTLSVDDTDGYSHSDITFNPDYQLQFAVINQNSTWSVWDIDYRPKRGVYTVLRTLQGSIRPLDEANNPEDDGWAKILWVGDVNTVVSCNRRVMCMISLQVGSFEYLPCPSLFSKRSTDWILDLRPHPRHTDRLFVLTTTHLLLMKVTTRAQALDTSVGEAGIHVLASLRHYRGVEDITLRISVQKISENGTCVLLHSNVNELIQFYIYNDEVSNSSAMSVFDPCLLRIQLPSRGRVLQIRAETMHMGRSHREGYHSGPGATYMARGIEFCRLFVLQSDLTVQEAVVHTSDSDIRVEDFERSLIQRPRFGRSRLDVVNEEEDDFVVPDGLVGTVYPKPKILSQLPKHFRKRLQLSQNSRRDNSLVYDALRSTSREAIDIGLVTNRLRQLLVHDDLQAASLTLKDIVTEDFHIYDVDEASAELQRLLTFNGEGGTAKIRSIASAQTLDLSVDNSVTVSSLYDAILDSWVASLPIEVSTRIRQHRERLCRKIAIEVLLSSHRFTPQQNPKSILISQPEQTHMQHQSIPVLPSKPGRVAQNDLSPLDFTHSLPTPPHSSIPSSSVPPSSPPMEPAQSELSNDPVSRLGNWLQIRKSSDIPPVVSPNVRQVLAHWQFGTDPHTYDWDAANDFLNPRGLNETSQQQREKERKRKERRERRQQRENELMMRQIASQTPVVFPRSSPGPILREFGDSSQVRSQANDQQPLPDAIFVEPSGFPPLVPQSQVEPGRFGGRPDKKKKKKTRVSGF